LIVNTLANLGRPRRESGRQSAPNPQGARRHTGAQHLAPLPQRHRNRPFMRLHFMRHSIQQRPAMALFLALATTLRLRPATLAGAVFLLFGSLLADVALAGGPRAFAGDTVQVKLQAIDNGILVVDDGLRLKLAGGVLIYNENNRTVTRSRLPVGITVRLALNRADEVQRVWILAADEIEASPENARLTRQRGRAATAVQPGGGFPTVVQP